MQLFANETKHMQYIYIYQIEAFFVKSMDLGLLPQNKASFGSDQGLKFCLHERTCQFFRQQTLTNLVSSCSESHEDSKPIEINWKGRQSWPKNGQNHCGYSSSRLACSFHRSPSDDETSTVRSLAAARTHGLALHDCGAWMVTKWDYRGRRRQWAERERYAKGSFFFFFNVLANGKRASQILSGPCFKIIKMIILLILNSHFALKRSHEHHTMSETHLGDQLTWRSKEVEERARVDR